jgi:hypothetical protein
MKVKGPILTLAAGVVLAAVVTALNMHTYHQQHKSTPAPAPTYGSLPTAAPAPTTAAPTTAAAVAEPPATYAGYVGGGGASIAIAVKDGRAIAYVCDGATAEAWLQGTAANGKLSLTGADGASVTGTYANGTATGTATATGKQWSFTVSTVAPPSGLYRAAANVANAQVVGGWIVLADGTEVGTARTGTAVTAAPHLNLPDRTAVINGTTVTAHVVDGTSLGD